jgi:hypothetical protein
MDEVRKGATMFTPSMVIWLVLLMLALNVITFVTRILEKYRLLKTPQDSSRTSERIVSVVQTGEPAILKDQPSQPTH